MIHLIGIGNDKANITLNAFVALKEADIVINYNDIDLSFFNSEIKDKEVISAIEIINGIDLYSEEELNPDNLEDISDSKDSNDLDSKELEINPKDAFLERILQENYIIELAISKSLESKEVALIVSDEPNILGLSNRFLQIASKFSDVEYRIYPGVSSVSQSASLIGAPLNDFAIINLSSPIMPLSEIENRIRHILEANLVLVIKNPVDDRREDGKEAYLRLKEIVGEYNDELLTAIAFNERNFTMDKFKDIDDEKIDRNSIIIIGNRLSYLLDGAMVTSSDYVVEPNLISWSIEFFEKYLNGESPRGLDYDCDYLPCHRELEACDFCYCPFYPCADGITGGEWIKDRDVWSCQDCDWIHKEAPCLAIREGLDDILKDIDDLKDEHIELLKLRRSSLLKTLK